MTKREPQTAEQIIAELGELPLTHNGRSALEAYTLGDRALARWRAEYLGKWYANNRPFYLDEAAFNDKALSSALFAAIPSAGADADDIRDLLMSAEDHMSAARDAKHTLWNLMHPDPPEGYAGE